MSAKHIVIGLCLIILMGCNEDSATEFYDSGALKSETIMISEDRFSIREYFEEGGLLRESEYKDSSLVMVKTYNATGELVGFDDFLQMRKSSWHFEGGKLISESHYVNGRRDSVWLVETDKPNRYIKFYHEDGKEVKSELFSNDTIIEAADFVNGVIVQRREYENGILRFRTYYHSADSLSKEVYVDGEISYTANINQATGAIDKVPAN